MELNTELLRWGLILLTFPLWGRFLGALWADFNDTLLEEGGLFGQPPTLQEMERLRADRAARPDLLVSEPWVQREAPRARGPRTNGPSRSASAFQPRPRKGGFR